MITAGVGCRAGCAVEHIMLALAAALASARRDIEEVTALCTADFKAEEAGLLAAARRLNKPLLSLSIGQLKLHAGEVLTVSEQVLMRFGVPSVAETAALAGAAGLAEAGARIRLLGPRQVSGNATCALASTEPER